MSRVNISEARKKLSELVKSTERGQSVIITRRGKDVARLAPPEEEPAKPLPKLKHFRASLGVTGKTLSETVIEKRDKERY